MTRLRRVGLSLSSALAAEIIVALGGSLAAERGSRGNHFALAIYYLSLVLPAWLLVVPVVLTFDRTDGWRVWVLACIGLPWGPVFLTLVALALNMHYSLHPTRIWPPVRYDILGISLAISSLATVFYLTWLLRSDAAAAASNESK